jgi:hypothetical protein
MGSGRPVPSNLLLHSLQHRLRAAHRSGEDEGVFVGHPNVAAAGFGIGFRVVLV